MTRRIRRGDIYNADISHGSGSVQRGDRPVLIIQNDTGNIHSSTVIAAAITSKRKGRQPTHCEILAQQGLVCDSFAMLEQIYTLDKSKLTDFLGSLDNDIMRRIDKALAKSLGLRKRDFIDYDAERGIECECDREKTASFNTG